MSSVFSKIKAGEIPGYFVAKNDEFFAILDINPLKEGHVLVIPSLEVDYIYDLPEDVLARYILFTQRVAKAIKKVIPCKRIGSAVIGLEVPHAHIHLVPMNSIGDLNFSNPKMSLDTASLQATAEAISKAFI